MSRAVARQVMLSHGCCGSMVNILEESMFVESQRLVGNVGLVVVRLRPPTGAPQGEARLGTGKPASRRNRKVVGENSTLSGVVVLATGCQVGRRWRCVARSVKGRMAAVEISSARRVVAGKGGK